MALRDWLFDSDQVATANLAKTAKKAPKSPSNLAILATLAVAAPLGNELSQGADLPEVCPLLGGSVPDECRFEAKLYRRMVNEGVLQLGGPCPLRKVCRL